MMQAARTLAAGEASDANSVRVLVVDDSAVVRGLTKRLLDDNDGISVVAAVADGELAVKAVKEQEVDVVVLDIEMPKMDGLTALPLLLKAQPAMRVIMSSTLTTRNADISMEALSIGAADYIPKPTSSKEIHGGGDFRRDLVEKVLALGMAARRGRAREARKTASVPESGSPKSTFPVTVPKTPSNGLLPLREEGKMAPEVLAIGSSTGGPQALFEFFKGLDQSFDLPIVITQHMPATFTKILATHLESIIGRPCKEAAGGEPLERGSIYVAPGGKHMLIERKGAQIVTAISDGPPENFCKPAVDPMLRSIVKMYGPRVLTVILTGMGQDGLRGCEDVVASGGTVIGQDEATSVVWGMPGAVATNGICSAVLPLGRIATFVSNFVKRTAP